jgi:hypothetical protein
VGVSKGPPKQHTLGTCKQGRFSFWHKRCSPKDLQQRLVHEPVDVLDMVVCLVGTFDLLFGLSGVDAFQDA